jgi:periplasmic protein TonB
MFELLSADRRRTPPRGATPLLISTAAHLIVLVILLAIPLVYVSTELPPVPDVLAFVVSAAPPPPPPPPPPAPASSTTPQKPSAARTVPATAVQSAPVKAPTEIAAERIVEAGSDQGVPGGVEGGVPGGVIGGVLGGLVGAPLPAPPPPAPPTVERAPVRIGGALTAPALLERVDPVYPPIAVQARVQGVVILEAVVDSSGRVEDVRVLRSIRLLDAAAMEAVRKWRYSPLFLNGTAERFVLTVTVSFRLST